MATELLSIFHLLELIRGGCRPGWYSAQENYTFQNDTGISSVPQKARCFQMARTCPNLISGRHTPARLSTEGFVIDYLTPENILTLLARLITFPFAIQEQLNKFAEVFNDEILKKGKYIRDLSKEIKIK